MRVGSAFPVDRSIENVEPDGSQHLDLQEYDLERAVYLELKDYRVPGFWNHEVMENSDGVLQVILGNIRFVIYNMDMGKLVFKNKQWVQRRTHSHFKYWTSGDVRPHFRETGANTGFGVWWL